LFRYTALGKREKAQKNNVYIDRTLQMIRAKEPSPVDLSKVLAPSFAQPAAKAPAPAPVAYAPPPAPLPPPQAPAPLPVPYAPARGTFTACGLARPPGLVGDIAEFILSTVTRPVPEVALTASMALLSGLVGRQYNISGTGLNQYIILIGKTGVGKDGGAVGVERLLAEVRKTVPLVDMFMGPSSFASGQGLIKTLDRQACFVSFINEFGLFLHNVTDPRASSSQVMLKKVLLDLYTKSGHGRILQSTAYSDSEKNTKMVIAPSVTIWGESTPGQFYDKLDAEVVSSGLLPRFSVVEYTGERPDRNPDSGMPPSTDLVRRVAELVQTVLSTMQNNVTVQVRLSDRATALMDDFDKECDRRIRGSGKNDAVAQIWNRAHLKALKIAATLAVGMDCHDAIVDVECATWAIEFVKKDAHMLADRFETGDVGQGDSRQEAELKRVLKEYFQSPMDILESYGVQAQVREANLVPYDYIRRRTIGLACFKESKFGATETVKRLLEEFVNLGILEVLTKEQAKANFGQRTSLYAVIKSW
jgi:hypothetical protein